VLYKLPANTSTDLRQLAISRQLAVVGLDDHSSAHQGIDALQVSGVEKRLEAMKSSIERNAAARVSAD